MRILLIAHPITTYGMDPTTPSASPPLGLAYIAGYMESFGYKVGILDALSLGIGKTLAHENSIRYGLSEREISEYISDFRPDIVGVTSMYTAYASDAHGVAKIAKKVDPDIFTVIGGAHASIFPKLVAKDKNVDAVVVGEGELTFFELVETIEKGGDISSIPGTVIKVGQKIVRNKPRAYIEDLDSLPFPARHLLPMELYSKSYYAMRTPAGQMITSRGCPYRCIFCSIHSVWGHKWRGRSPDNVVDEIELMVNEYGIREIHFLDDNIATSKKRMEGICDEIIRRGLDVKWTTPNGISHWRLDFNLLRKMKKSGCYRLTFGIESGNTLTRKFIRKPHDLEQAKRIIKEANRIGLWTVCTFILGFPYETWKQINDTINYAVNCDTDYAVFFLLMPFPGTPVYEVFKKEGLLNFDHILASANPSTDQLSSLGSALAQSGCDTKYFTREELEEYLTLAYTTFANSRFKSFLNPMRIIRKIHSTEDLIYTLKIITRGTRIRRLQGKHKKVSPHMIPKSWDRSKHEKKRGL